MIMKIILQTILIFLCAIYSVQYVQASSVQSIKKTSAQIAQTAKKIDGLKIYIEALIDNGYKIFNDKTISNTERTKRIRALISSHLDLDWMAKSALGHHRRTISKDKISEFSKVYSQFVIKAYTDLSISYGGEKAVLKKIRKIDHDMFIVNMEILRPNGQQPIKIDYLIHQINTDKNEPYRIGDIITEGISILNSQQAEFNSFISNKGIDKLINDLRNRTNYKKSGTL